MKKGQIPAPSVGSDILDYIESRKLAEPRFLEAYQNAFERLQFARDLKQAREVRGISQSQLAQLVGTKQPSIARLESGRVTPRIDLLQKIANALGMKLVVRLEPFDLPRRPE
jgi:ribosome-binding protein aMBF1 (putative translation factor)